MFTPTTLPSANPFGQSLQQQQAQPQQAPQQQQTPNPWSQQQQAPNPWSQPQQQLLQPSQMSSSQVSNPWQGQQSYQTQDPHKNYQAQQQSFQSQQQLYQQQSSNPFDKNSILSLYNQPQHVPQQIEQQQAPPATAQTSTPTAQAPSRSNPFASMSAAPQGQPLSAAQTPGVRHVSNESADFSGLMGGRHSPDAFSGLSASFRR
jgi:hypothetical protein